MRIKHDAADSLRKIRDYLILLLLLFLLSFFVGHSQFTQRKAAGKEFTLTMKIIYENKGESQEIWNLTRSDRAIGLFMNNSWQIVYLLSASYPVEGFTKDLDGNIIAILNFGRDKIYPGETINYSITYRLIFRARSLPKISETESWDIASIPKELKDKYCEPTGLWQSNMSQLHEKALEIAGGETRVLSILKRFVAWIRDNIRYDSSEVPRYPNETLSLLAGDCDDQANLLITFCRSIGIPAYLQIGCIYIPQYDRSLRYWSGHLLIRQIGVGWHGWAMVYVPPWGWLPVDLTYVRRELLEDNPLNSIIFSAVIAHYTFQYMNITRTDYVAESRAMRDFLMSHEFYIHEEDNMEERRVEGSLLLRPILVATACRMLLNI
ncbi:MAG: transglutaminase domain-containing protein [Candidatus Bathyarchaeia archaeon]|nr:transglutaminase domain-containing protein [Candidatus Bathyarchaeota archaeon]